jgi:hypothetical protein
MMRPLFTTTSDDVGEKLWAEKGRESFSVAAIRRREDSTYGRYWSNEQKMSEDPVLVI